MTTDNRPLDRRLLVVLAGPRSGSNFLCSILDGAPGMLSLSEVFNPRDIFGLNNHPALHQRLLDRFGSEEKLHHAFRMTPELAADALMAETATARQVMIKVFPNQVHGAALRAILARHGAGAIFLVRRRLDQFISLHKAMSQDLWHSAETTDLRPAIDTEQYLRWTAVMDEWIRQTARACQQLGLPVASLRYERDLLDPDPESRAHALAARLAALPCGFTPQTIRRKSFFRRQDISDDPFVKVADGTRLKEDLNANGVLDQALSAMQTPFDRTEPGPMQRRNREASADMATHLAARRFGQLRSLLDKVGFDIEGDPRVPAPLRDADHSFRHLTFICGLHRSGTTLLHDALAARFDVAHLISADVPRHEGQFLQDVAPQERPFGGPGSFAFHAPMCPGPVEDPAEAQVLADRMLRTWAGYATDPQHPHLLEKSPPNLTRIAWLRSLFPNARFLVLVRDPRAVVIATRKWQRLPVETLLLHWNAAHWAALRALDDDCLVLSYEGFCADPIAATDQAAAFCGMVPRTDQSARGLPEIKSTNAAYLARFPKDVHLSLPFRTWEVLGYDLRLAGDVPA
ncbi:sulfotransferase [Pseudotabrizicola sp. 4114]|uniref:sulfotransferase n=1 Tax=Pseudotabrizicola sp. 4114 TaxID=2817731 RepID=UPI00285D2CA2|nr:LPS sulfotransferase NodH [Pseudorhodobacter sp. 4114]